MISKPLFWLLVQIQSLVSNWGIAIIIITIIVKGAMYPLTKAQYTSMARMRELQPKMQQLKERFGDDRQKMGQATMELYRKEKVNPAAGCLPILLQIPIFFSLYKVIFVTIELRHAAFFGPFQDLSAPDPTSLFNFFGLLPWGAPEAGTIMALICGALGGVYLVFAKPFVVAYGPVRMTAYTFAIGFFFLWTVVGIGWGVWVNPLSITQKTETQVIGILTIGILGLTFDLILRWLHRKLFPYLETHDHQ